MALSDIYRSILDKARQIGLYNVNSFAARKWFQAQAAKFKGVTPNDLMHATPENLMPTKQISPLTIGRMIMFFYDPLWKDKLPYYDRFPVIFAVDFPLKNGPGGPGFYGINLHYLSPYLRAQLFDALMRQKIIGENEQKRIKISYGILKSASELKAFKPCFKRYLYGHVRSRFMIVDPKEWATVMFLPVARFEKGGKGGGMVGGPVSQQKVWADSKKKIN
jgi:hypothetical protein